MMSCQTSEEKLAGVYIAEKVDRKTGWQYVCLERTRGYLQEIPGFHGMRRDQSGNDLSRACQARMLFWSGANSEI
jgi:hypothetical protein